MNTQKTPILLWPALRQYRHTNSPEFLAGYDCEEINEVYETLQNRIAELEKKLSHAITEGDKQQAIKNLRQQAKGVEDGIRLTMMSYTHINSIGLMKYAKKLTKQADELEKTDGIAKKSFSHR